MRDSRLGEHVSPSNAAPLPHLKLFGRGEWQEEKHGRAPRSWRKMHLALDAVTGEIVAHALTDKDADDAGQLPVLLEQVEGEIASVTADGAYDGEPSYEAAAARERGEDVIILSICDPDISAPEAVIERAVAQLRAGDTHYTPARGRDALRAAIAQAHTERTGQFVAANNVVCLAGTQNALFVASLCLAGPGDEVITFDPLLRTRRPPNQKKTSGRPVVTMRTGFSKFCPVGRGLFEFSTAEEALEGLAAIDRDYARHSRAARALSEEYFSSDRVVRRLLNDAGL